MTSILTDLLSTCLLIFLIGKALYWLIYFVLGLTPFFDEEGEPVDPE